MNESAQIHPCPWMASSSLKHAVHKFFGGNVPYASPRIDTNGIICGICGTGDYRQGPEVELTT